MGMGGLWEELLGEMGELEGATGSERVGGQGGRGDDDNDDQMMESLSPFAGRRRGEDGGGRGEDGNGELQKFLKELQETSAASSSRASVS